MKREILRLEKVSIPPFLNEINCHLCQGEIVGLIPINSLGIEQLIKVIKNEISLHYGYVYYKGTLVNDYLAKKSLKTKVIVIDKNSTLIESMSVEENLFVLRKGFRQHIVKTKLLEDQFNRITKKLGVNIESRTQVGNLSSFEKRALEFIKALVIGAPLVIVKDISTYVSDNDLIKLHKLMQVLKDEGISFLYICAHHQETFSICSRSYLIEEGHMIKHLNREQQTNEIMKHFSFEFSKNVEREERIKLFKEPLSKKIILKAKNVYSGNIKNFNLEIAKGEAVVILDIDNKSIEQLLAVIAKKKHIEKGIVLLDNKKITKKDRRLSIVPSKPLDKLLFFQLSVIDNICFCCDYKLPFIWLSFKKRKAIAKELSKKFGDWVFESSLINLNDEKLYDILCQRIILQKPKLVIFVQPFASLDMFQRMKLIKYFDEFRQKGISVCILAVSLSDTLQVADKLLVLKNGVITQKYHRDEFVLFHGNVGSTPNK